MHMCVYSYHNGEIYSEQTNCFVIANLDCHSRYFKIEINYSPIVIVPMIKYKAAPEPIVPLALVDSSPSQTTKQSSSTESYLNKRFPT